MWTVYSAELKTNKEDSSNPENDVENFKNFIKSLHKKLQAIKEGKCDFRIEDDKLLSIDLDDEENVWFNFYSNGHIEVGHPAA